MKKSEQPNLSLREMQMLPAEDQKKLFAKLDFIRNQAKTCNYSALYNAGAKTVAENIGIKVSEAQVILDAYWKRNWAVKKVSQMQVIKEITESASRVKGNWLWNPVSKSYVYMRNKKDVFSALNQSTGAYIFDLWLMNILARRSQITGQFHDSVVLHVKNNNRDAVKRLLQQCLDKLNKEVGLNVKFGMDIKFGDDYSFTT